MEGPADRRDALVCVEVGTARMLQSFPAAHAPDDAFIGPARLAFAAFTAVTAARKRDTLQYGTAGKFVCSPSATEEQA